MNDQMLMQLLEKIKALQKQLDHLDRIEGGSGWIDYSAVSTIVGWSSFTTQQIFYSVMGKLIFVQYNLAGTSDSASVTFTLPYTLASLTAIHVPSRIQDNGAAHVWGMVEIFGSASIVNIYPTIGGGSWTASGTKSVVGEFWYQIS